MAEELESFDFSTGRKAKYDWDKFLNGSIWKLTSGKDFDTSPSSMRCTIFAAAKRRGLNVRSSVRKDDVIFQAHIKSDRSDL